MADTAPSTDGLTLKEKGNKLFSEHKFEEAIKMYTEAIEEQETAVLYSNRAFCWLKLDMYGAALADAQKAIALDPNYAKGSFIVSLLISHNLTQVVSLSFRVLS